MRCLPGLSCQGTHSQWGSDPTLPCTLPALSVDLTGLQRSRPKMRHRKWCVYAVTPVTPHLWSLRGCHPGPKHLTLDCVRPSGLAPPESPPPLHSPRSSQPALGAALLCLPVSVCLKCPATQLLTPLSRLLVNLRGTAPRTGQAWTPV